MSKTYNRSFDREVTESFGIGILTGEACAYSMRVLCDINEDGLELINSAFGMILIHVPELPRSGHLGPRAEHVTGMMRRHNSQVNGKPSVASIMLSWPMLEEIIKFGIVEKHLELGEVVIDAKPRKGYSIYFATPKRLYWLLKRIAKLWFSGERKLDFTPSYRVNSFMWGGTQEEYEERFMDGDYFHDNWDYRKYYIYDAQPRRGSMNVHAFSGRAP